MYKAPNHSSQTKLKVIKWCAPEHRGLKERFYRLTLLVVLASPHSDGPEASIMLLAEIGFSEGVNCLFLLIRDFSIIKFTIALILTN
jgi:hypothetical protein